MSKPSAGLLRISVVSPAILQHRSVFASTVARESQHDPAPCFLVVVPGIAEYVRFDMLQTN